MTLAVLLGSEVRGSDLPVCEGSPLLGKSGNTNNPYLLLWNNCVGVYDPFTGSVYAGEWQWGRRHGPGITKFFNGRVQTGIWKGGVFQREQKVNLNAHVKEYIFPKGSKTKITQKDLPTSQSDAEKENERLRKRIAELEKDKQS